MLHAITLRTVGDLTLVQFVHDDLELALYRDAARSLGEALVRASFTSEGGEELWVDGSELRAVDDHKRHGDCRSVDGSL